MKIIAATALAALLSCPAWAENTVVFMNDFKVTILGEPICESAERYNSDWVEFRGAKGLGNVMARQKQPTQFGVIDTVIFSADDGVRVMFGYVQRDKNVCLLSYAEPSKPI